MGSLGAGSLRSRRARICVTLIAATLGCRSLGRSPGNALADASPPPIKTPGTADASQKSAPSPGYPVDNSPPKDFFSDALLRTLTREATAIVICKLIALTDAFADRKEPDVFYDASCDVVEVRAGSAGRGPLHFIWQVERGARMPPPGAELLVYLKLRKEPLDGPPSLKWVALDAGVMRYTDALHRKLGQSSRQARKER